MLKYTDPFNYIYILQIYFIPISNCFSLVLVTSLRVTNERRIACCLLSCTSKSTFRMSTRQIKFQVTGTDVTKTGLSQFRICLFYMGGKFKSIKRSITIQNTLIIGQRVLYCYQHIYNNSLIDEIYV
jgi:hypothetical protein